MQKLTWNKGLLLTALLLTGCCDTFDSYEIAVPSDNNTHTYPSYPSYPTEPVIHRPYVVNNTPHVRRQPLPSSYNEKVKEIGLVGAHGELL